MNLPVEFGRPWALAMLLVLAPMAWLAWTTRAPLRTGRWWLAMAARVVLVLALVAAVADTRWSSRTDRLAVLFLVDGSRSCGPRAMEVAARQIETEVRRMASSDQGRDSPASLPPDPSGDQEMRDDDQFGVIVFGQRPQLRRALGTKGPVELEPLDPALADFTNIDRALRYATSLLYQSECRRRIVLLSDGNENLGDAVDAARSAAAGGIDLLVAPLAAAHDAEVLVDEIVVPQRVRTHQPIELRANIRSTTATDVDVKVFRDGRPLSQGIISLQPGPNIVRLATDSVAEPQFCRYEVVVKPVEGSQSADRNLANNTGLACTQVTGQARVLYLEGYPEHAARLARALRAGADRPTGGFSLVAGSTGDVPQTIDEMASYDCIILSDIPASAMTPGQMTALKQYVELAGGGLIMIGGEKSLTTGGYLQTPIEDALPVSLHLEREKHLASLAVVIVVDKSGSMGMTVPGGKMKMDLANQACADAVNLLAPYDQAAVCVVDMAPKWVHGKLRPMNDANKYELMRAVKSCLPGGGGIVCRTGLFTAYQELRNSTAQTRHIILFADAADCDDQAGCDALVRQNLAGSGITLTTVGLGARLDPHAAFLRRIAEQQGGGRFYITEDARKLPEIFAKDTYIVSRNAIVEVPDGFRAIRTSAAEAIGNIDWRQAPPLYGYVATMPTKPKAEILLLAKDDEPLLARWRFGLGKATVFTSDAKDRWARQWQTWPDFDRFWGQLVRWTMREARRGNINTQIVAQGHRHKILVDAIDADGQFINGKTLTARVLSADPAVEPEKLALHQVGPGRYAAEFDVTSSGLAWQVVIVDSDQAQETVVDSAGAVLSYPPEYRDLQPNTALLSRIAEAGGGRYMEVPAGVFRRDDQAASAMRSVWAILILAATVLLVLDIASRRLVVPDWLARRKDDTRQRILKSADQVMTHLRDTRDGLRQRAKQFDTLPADGAPAEPRDATLGATLLGARRTDRFNDTLGLAPPGETAPTRQTAAAPPEDDDIVPLRAANTPPAAPPDDTPPSPTPSDNAPPIDNPPSDDNSLTNRLLRSKRRPRDGRKP